MQGLEEVKDEVHSLGLEIAGLKPLVNEVHNNMPRIAKALETLATVTERLESNTEDHKRLHYRISEVDNDVKVIGGRHDDLALKFEALQKDFIICTTRKSAEKASLLTRLKEKAAEKTVELMLVAIICFAAWLVVYHLPHYPVTSTIINQGGITP